MKQNNNQETLVLLEKIIQCGGLIGDCAAVFRNDETLADEFIRDCAQQCKETNINEFWGDSLTAEIINYTAN